MRQWFMKWKREIGIRWHQGRGKEKRSWRISCQILEWREGSLKCSVSKLLSAFIISLFSKFLKSFFSKEKRSDEFSVSANIFASMECILFGLLLSCKVGAMEKETSYWLNVASTVAHRIYCDLKTMLKLMLF